MRIRGKFAALGLFLAAACAVVVAQNEKRQAQPRATATAADRSADEKAIRDAGAAFVRTYNAGDARAIADLFTPDAEVIDEHGHRIQGRDAIAGHFAQTFDANPGETIEVAIDSIRFLGREAAKEEGRARLTPAPASAQPSAKIRAESPGLGHAPHSSGYTVLYVRQDGRWLQSSVREHVDEAVTPHQRLEPLGWLLGEWVDEGGASVVSSDTRWSEDGNFLIRAFTLHVQGRPAMSGTQRIGWDPLTRQIKSWVFDSEGGHGEALWSRDGSRWVVKASGVLPDGRVASATQVYTVVNPHLVHWKSIDRTAGEQVESDTAEFVMVRKPPRPK
jgi:uncharacterized protein (TIGR02246 family)